MVEQPAFYIGEDIAEDTSVAAALFSMMEQALVEAAQNPGGTITATVRSLGKANALSQIAIDSYDIIINGNNNSVLLAAL